MAGQPVQLGTTLLECKHAQTTFTHLACTSTTETSVFANKLLFGALLYQLYCQVWARVGGYWVASAAAAFWIWRACWVPGVSEGGVQGAVAVTFTIDAVAMQVLLRLRMHVVGLVPVWTTSLSIQTCYLQFVLV